MQMAGTESAMDLRILDEMGQRVYIADIKTHELYYLSRAARQELGCDKIDGRPCYEVLQGLDAPCPFCNNERLQQERVCRWDNRNVRTGRTYQLEDRLIDYGGRPARLELAVDVSERERRRAELATILDVERRMVGTIQMLSGSAPLPERLQQMLEQIGTYFNAERAYLFELDDPTHLSNTYEWCAPGVAPQKDALQHGDIALIGRWMPAFEQHRALVTPDIEAVRESYPREYQTMIRQNIHSYAEAPLLREGRFAGFLGLDNPAPDKVADAAGQLLSLAYVVSSAIQRDRDEKQLIDSRRRYELAIKGANLAVWEYDIVTHRLTIPEGMVNLYAQSRYGLAGRVVENVPESMLPLGYTDADRAAFLQLYREIGAGKQYATAEVWFCVAPGAEPRCERISYYTVVDADGRPVRAYGVGTDVTAQKRDQLHFHQSVQSILTANPQALCVFQVNLTRDRCYEGHGASAYILRTLQADTAEALFANGARITASEEDRRRFAEVCDRSALLADFAAGRHSRWVEYRRLGVDGRPFWVRTYINLLQNPDTHDVECVIYSLDISRERLRQQILDIITGQEYDLIALLHLPTRQFEAVFVGKTLPAAYRALLARPGDICSFDELCRRAKENWVDDESREFYRQNSDNQDFRRLVAQDGHYEFTLHEHFDDKPADGVYRRFQHYALEGDPNTILIIESDVTETYRRQLRENEYIKSEAQRVQDILDYISSGVCVLVMPDEDHLAIEYFNRQMPRLLGMDADLGKASLDDAFAGVHPDDLKRVRAAFRCGYHQQQFSVPSFRLRGKNSYR